MTFLPTHQMQQLAALVVTGKGGRRVEWWYDARAFLVPF